jgi:hypothetical protein
MMTTERMTRAVFALWVIFKRLKELFTTRCMVQKMFSWAQTIIATYYLHLVIFL